MLFSKISSLSLSDSFIKEYYPNANIPTSIHNSLLHKSVFNFVNSGRKKLCKDFLLTMTMTMITDLLNINVAMNCYERAQALHAI